ncbi:unnamed protein product, partial [marine sediment metagenome]
MTVYLGGARSGSLCGLDDFALGKIVQEELGEILGLKEELKIIRTTRWERAIPQYGQAQSDLMDAI